MLSRGGELTSHPRTISMMVCTKLNSRLKNTSVYPRRLGRPIDEVSKVELSLFDRFMPMKNWMPSIIMTPIPVYKLCSHIAHESLTEILECESKKEWACCLSDFDRRLSQRYVLTVTRTSCMVERGGTLPAMLGIGRAISILTTDVSDLRLYWYELGRLQSIYCCWSGGSVGVKDIVSFRKDLSDM
jgi:hypothetical protein